ncbi:MAG: WecB/TagA/CpsF family glycosyltransferase [Chloroflexi bacterium]|nr:WecB/TagA/CpsF family glycosyltransferase [Chloroflexota bacterium]
MGMRIHLLGVDLDAVTQDQLCNHIVDAVQGSRRRVIANHNLHSIYLFHHDPGLREFYRETEVNHIDSMPLVFLARMMGYKVDRIHRVTYMDWIWKLMEMSEARSWQVYYLGGRPGIADQAAIRIKRRFPTLKLDTMHGYFNKQGDENEKVLDMINAARPNILFVGMGMPLQEKWIYENLDRLHANAILTAGACFDYIAGRLPTPPRWLGQIGLEWSFRLFSEPRRLWKRYLVEPWFLSGVVLKELRSKIHRPA